MATAVKHQSQVSVADSPHTGDQIDQQKDHSLAVTCMEFPKPKKDEGGSKNDDVANILGFDKGKMETVAK